MAEKPILFNTGMVKAILDGRKTQTRRLCKGQPQDGTTSPEKIGYKPPVQPGDVIWVRETWDRYLDSGTGKAVYIYRTHDRNRRILEDVGGYQIKWRPSIHMPREACRLFLKVKDMRCERLHDMKMSDIQAEGVVPPTVNGGQWQQWQQDYMKPVWDSTIKKADLPHYGWNANPWVWVIEFERMEGTSWDARHA